MRTRPTALALLAVVTVLVGLAASPPPANAQPTVGRYREFGDGGGFLNILPPGSDGSMNATEIVAAQGGTFPPHYLDQLGMYGDLVYAAPGLTEAEILDYYKDASFGTPEADIERTYSPTAGVTVVRDASFGVPHIFGDTRYATMFAQGYTGAEDRLFLMDVLRHVGRGRMSEFLGASAANIHMDRDTIALAPYTEADLTAQVLAFQNGDADHQAIAADALAYVDGVNAYIDEALADFTKLPGEYLALQLVPQPWKPEDTVAIASLVGGIFGKGGGGELRNLCGLKSMTTALGSAATARAVFDDLHFANDPEAPTTSRTTTPYNQNLGPVNPAAHPDVDCDSLTPIEPTTPSLQELLDVIARGPTGLNLPLGISNAMLVGGTHTRNGNPIAVFGPQTSYYAPQLLVEKDVHGPGIDARGVAFAGTDIYVQLGRGGAYAWSATSSGGDNVDQWVLLLCEPGGGPATTSSMAWGTCTTARASPSTPSSTPRSRSRRRAASRASRRPAASAPTPPTTTPTAS
jgi:acyl-homoserine lactone acylase PvdQ